MENILPRREARENAFLLAFSQTFGDIPLVEAIINHEENDEILVAFRRGKEGIYRPDDRKSGRSECGE